MGDYVLTLACTDQPGIVHAVTTFLVDNGGNIRESQQFGDRTAGRFFMRIDFETARSPTPRRSATASQTPRGASASATSSGRPHAPYRTLIMVSKQLHCLNDLLFRHHSGDLQIEVPRRGLQPPGRRAAGAVLRRRLPPPTPHARHQGRGRGASSCGWSTQLRIDLVVLARYMQILSDGLCRQLSGRAINIHHSFLPSFKGAKPYHQAYERGVKLVGATAHYVTADLDEGPIIEQDVTRVDHTLSADQLVAAGRDVEAQVLSRAVRWHSQSRILTNGTRTVVFR